MRPRTILAHAPRTRSGRQNENLRQVPQAPKTDVARRRETNKIRNDQTKDHENLGESCKSKKDLQLLLKYSVDIAQYIAVAPQITKFIFLNQLKSFLKQFVYLRL